jgi:hypothetical protein
MGFEEIRYEIDIKEYNDRKVEEICRIHSASLKEVIMDDNKVTLVMKAPTSWRYILLQSILEPYRYM